MIGSYRPIRGGRGLRIGLAIRLASSAVAGSLHAATVVNDSWADAGRTNGADPQDAAWWSSTASNGNAIEVSLNNLGLISGTSGRGIHGTFAPPALAEGERMTVTFTFTTLVEEPASIVTLVVILGASIALDLGWSRRHPHPDLGGAA